MRLFHKLQRKLKEERQVEAACSRGGMKIAPSKDVLDAFLRACEGLNATVGVIHESHSSRLRPPSLEGLRGA